MRGWPVRRVQFQDPEQVLLPRQRGPEGDGRVFEEGMKELEDPLCHGMPDALLGQSGLARIPAGDREDELVQVKPLNGKKPAKQMPPAKWIRCGRKDPDAQFPVSGDIVN